jgi:general secretion pathway protein D
LSDLNQRAIDVGTGNSLELRRVARPSSSTPASSAPQTPAPPKPPTPAPPQPQSQLPNASQPNTGQQPIGQPPGATPVETASAAAPSTPSPSAGTTSLRIDPPNLSPTAGSTFTVNVTVAGAKDMYSAPMQISYDPNLLQFMNVTNGDMLSRDGQAVALVHREDAGSIQANATRPPGSGGISGDGVIYTLTFKAKGTGTTNVTVRPSVRNSSMQVIPVSVAPAVISVK